MWVYVKVHRRMQRRVMFNEGLQIDVGHVGSKGQTGAQTMWSHILYGDLTIISLIMISSNP